MAKSLIAAIIGLTVAFVINKLLEQRKLTDSMDRHVRPEGMQIN